MALDPNYDFLVRRKYPLLSIIEYANKLAEGDYYLHSMLNEINALNVQNARNEVFHFIEAAYFIIEGIVREVPELKETSYMGSYESVMDTYPEVMKILGKAREINKDEAQTILKTIWYMKTFALELT